MTTQQACQALIDKDSSRSYIVAEQTQYTKCADGQTLTRQQHTIHVFPTNPYRYEVEISFNDLPLDQLLKHALSYLEKELTAHATH